MSIDITNYRSQATSGGSILLEAKEIESDKEDLENSGLNPLMSGAGMTFLHEALHTNFNANFFGKTADFFNYFKDGSAWDEQLKGNVVDKINEIREQVGLATREQNIKYPKSIINIIKGKEKVTWEKPSGEKVDVEVTDVDDANDD